MRSGDVFSRTTALEDVERLKALNAAKGQAALEVTPQTQLDNAALTVNLVFEMVKPKP